MKKSTIIYLAIAAVAGYAYFAYSKERKKEDNSKKNIDADKPFLPIVNVEKPPARKKVILPQKLNAYTQLNAFSYDKKKRFAPVAQSLDTIRNAIFVQPIKPFTLNPAKQPAVQNAAKKQKAKKAKLGMLGVSYLYV